MCQEAENFRKFFSGPETYFPKFSAVQHNRNTLFLRFQVIFGLFQGSLFTFLAITFYVFNKKVVFRNLFRNRQILTVSELLLATFQLDPNRFYGPFSWLQKWSKNVSKIGGHIHIIVIMSMFDVLRRYTELRRYLKN